jgi:hypothetical protein
VVEEGLPEEPEEPLLVREELPGETPVEGLLVEGGPPEEGDKGGFFPLTE